MSETQTLHPCNAADAVFVLCSSLLKTTNTLPEGGPCDRAWIKTGDRLQARVTASDLTGQISDIQVISAVNSHVPHFKQFKHTVSGTRKRLHRFIITTWFSRIRRAKTTWHRLKCDGHGVYFNANSLHDAAKHLHSPQHTKGTRSPLKSWDICSSTVMLIWQLRRMSLVKERFSSGHRPFNHVSLQLVSTAYD